VETAISPIALAVLDPAQFLEPVRALLQRLTFQKPGPDTDLLATGLLDSVILVQLVVALEREFDMEIFLDEVGVESFRSVTSIASLVAGAKTAAPAIEPMRSGPRPDLVLQIQLLIEETFSVRVESAGQDLFDSGVVDSIILVQLILRLEERFGVDLVMEDLDLNAFATTGSIALFLETCFKKAGSAAV
jgi:methoxymalonate biosynthesis acyl carrier protein